MSDLPAAEEAAKALAKQLGIPSWQGGVSVWWKDGDLQLQVFVEPSWLAKTNTNIPAEYRGFKVEQGPPLKGMGYQRSTITKYA